MNLFSKMNSSMLASGGDNIKFWNLNNKLESVKQIKPHGGAISSITWSNDNLCLASASNSGDKIVLTSSSNFESMSLEGKETKAKTCLAFDSLSNHLAAGGPQGIINIWNLKTSRLMNTLLQLKGPTTCLQFNYQDSIIAASSETAGLMIFNLKLNLFQSLSLGESRPVASGIRSLQYNYVKHSLLATVSDDSSTILWDTEVPRPVHIFQNGHKRPATDLAFSPLNQLFLISVGLDKAIVFYDVLDNRIINILHTDKPLTSVDILDDGKTIAVGSSNGFINIYDVRAINVPVASVFAHNNPVKVKFQKYRMINDIRIKNSVIRKYSANDTSEINSCREDPNVSNQTTDNIKSEFLVQPANRNRNLNLKVNPNEDFCNLNDEHLNLSNNIKSQNNFTLNNPNNTLPNISTNKSITLKDNNQNELNNKQINDANSSEAKLNSNMSVENIVKHPLTSNTTTIPKDLKPETITLERKYIREILRDEMDTYFDQIHKDVLSLHNDMIIKFQFLQEEILSSIKATSINNSLFREIERLRLENETLKKNL